MYRAKSLFVLVFISTLIIFISVPFATFAHASSQPPVGALPTMSVAEEEQVGPEILSKEEITSEVLESYDVDPALASSTSIDELAEAIDENPILEAEVTENAEVSVYHPFTNRSLVVKNAGDIPSEALSSKYNELIDSYIVTFADEDATARAYKQITSNSGIDATFPDVSVGTCGVSYTDYDGWGISDMNLSTVEYKLNASPLISSRSLIMAVIDTGVFRTHEIFTNTNILPESGSIIDSGDKVGLLTSSSYADNDGHGTHVTGILAQGTPSSVKLLVLKCYNDKTKNARLSDIYNALIYAQRRGAKVFNISLGAEVGRGKTALSSIASGEKILKRIYDNGGLMFTAAGNSGRNLATANMYPAVSKYTYSVGALDRGGSLADYSNYGASLDFVAPGSSILSSNNISKTSKIKLSGTSMACPHVAAAAADLCLMYPTYTSSQIIKTLQKSCVDLGSKGKDSVFGYGKPLITVSSVNSALKKIANGFKIMPNGKLKPNVLLFSGVSSKYRYTGKYISPKPTIAIKIDNKKKTLTRFKDYNLYYYNNRNVGTARIRIQLIGDYTGSYSIRYDIKKR